ncbi:unnamed protein product [Urochloa humidicola]
MAISECWEGKGEWSLDFGTPFGTEDVKEWENLIHVLDAVKIDESKDRIRWVLEKSGQCIGR